MNGNKFAEIRRQILSMNFIEREAVEPAAEFPAPVKNIETEIKKNIQLIEQERRNIDRDISTIKTPTQSALETISFPDPLPKDASKILAQQSETLRQLVAEQIMLEKNLSERKSAFAMKKAALHQKFLQSKGR